MVHLIMVVKELEGVNSLPTRLLRSKNPPKPPRLTSNFLLEFPMKPRVNSKLLLMETPIKFSVFN